MNLTLPIMIALLAAGAHAQDSDRAVVPGSFQFTSVAGSPDTRVDFDVTYATQLNGPVNMSMDILARVNNGLVAILPVSISTPVNNGGQTCGTTCGTPDCSLLGPHATCSDFGALGGQGCACTITFTHSFEFPLVPGDVVEVEVVPALASMIEVFNQNDRASAAYSDIFFYHCSRGGDGMGCTDCPCGNGSHGFGGCHNSNNRTAKLFATGDTSVSLPPFSVNDLRLNLRSASQHSFCVLISGEALAPTNPMNPCFGLGSGVQSNEIDGLRCAVGNVLRHGGRLANTNGDVGAGNSAWGGADEPIEGLAQMHGGFPAGGTRFFQVIYRDQPFAACMSALNSSQAVEVTFTP